MRLHPQLCSISCVLQTLHNCNDSYLISESPLAVEKGQEKGGTSVVTVLLSTGRAECLGSLAVTAQAVLGGQAAVLHETRFGPED